MTDSTAALESVQRLRAQREEIVSELARLTDQECRYPAQWGGMTRTVNFVLRAFSLHDLDHLQHLHKLLTARGRDFSEAEILLAKAHALRAEVEALILGLSNEEFEATGPNEGDWSAHQLVDHMRETDARYRDQVRTGLQEGRAQAAGVS